MDEIEFHTLPPETDAERRHRIACETVLIAEAKAEIAAGLYVGSADVKRWIDSLGTDHELLPPYPQPAP